MPAIRNQAEWELQARRDKLVASYQAILSDFSSPDLHTVGSYTLGRLLGKGSFGKVYLGHHKLTNGSKVVLKSADKSDANLAREIHHHRQFLHPHIARLYEVIVTESLVWLVLEYCPGDELYNHLLQHGRIEVEKVQKIFTQLVGAVSYVHGKNCVHRDLKLENILLDKHENVKLIDFGFTREYQGSTSYLQTWCGTVCYSAPEMLKGEKYAGEKVDLWSLGIILYALLCGELPFDEDDDTATKALILHEEPKYPDYMPEQAKQLIKKLLSKRPLLRPCLSDILKDPWLADHAPQQQEILKLQQPAPFSTQLEKDTLQRMKSAGVDIDMVIENVLSQRCDSLAGWWALLIEKEQRKERRRERRRKDRDSESKSVRRLSAASGRLLSLGEIHEGEEHAIGSSPARRVSRGRRMTRTSINGRPASSNLAEPPDLPKVNEVNGSTSPDDEHRPTPVEKDTPTIARQASRSSSRPEPPPKEGLTTNVARRPRNVSRGSQSMLRVVATNPDLLSPSYVPPQQRKRRIFYQQPIREQLAMVKHWFKENAKRAKSPTQANNKPKAGVNTTEARPSGNKPNASESGSIQELQRRATGPISGVGHRKASYGHRPDLQSRATFPARPRLNTNASNDSRGSSTLAKRTSHSPSALTPHSSVRRISGGIRGRKSTSSSVSSVRSMMQASHQHTHSKASSVSSDSLASPSAMSSASGSRLGRSPHSSVKVLPSTPTGGSFSLPSGIRVSRRPPPSAIGGMPSFAEAKTSFGNMAPNSPGIPVFARRKRSVFKGPMAHPTGSPAGFGRTPLPNGSRSGSLKGRRSGDIHQVLEEDEEAELEAEAEMYGESGDDDAEQALIDEDDEDVEEVDHFGPELSGLHEHLHSRVAVLDDDVGVSPGHLTPVTPLPEQEADKPPRSSGSGGSKTSGQTPLTAGALAQKDAQDDAEQAKKAAEAEKVRKSMSGG
ncbi:kinase-like protein [Polychaeton citri CBS 116435]|uniref:Kinase-like protein n=1 Tax=Polychaeton citri CBS 116435 TaxID=1314669 RepID=A0A9P4UUY5_9PEZI|nr:kinase-like protein [Polychaeton citri CBS 116435]